MKVRAYSPQKVRRALPPYPPHRLCVLAHPLRLLRLFQITAYWREWARMGAPARWGQFGVLVQVARRCRFVLQILDRFRLCNGWFGGVAWTARNAKDVIDAIKQEICP